MNLQILHVDDYYGDQKSRGPDWGLTSSWRPFGLLDFVLRALRALRPVRQARLRSGPVKIGHFYKWAIFVKIEHFLKMGVFLKMIFFD